MPPERGRPAKRLEWSPRARAAYLATLEFIASEDPAAALLVRERVERVLQHVAAYPGIGTPGMRRGERRLPIQNTGHVFNYRVTRSSIRIQSWYRARQGSHR